MEEYSADDAFCGLAATLVTHFSRKTSKPILQAGYDIQQRVQRPMLQQRLLVLVQVTILVQVLRQPAQLQRHLRAQLQRHLLTQLQYLVRR